ncbi:MAG: 30S ribosomal protein S8 [Actinomycetota bacterium]|nr:30S ribosomal protein S8 [Actinomycetota bacterium]
MMYTDPIADMLTRIRNANQALHAEVSMPASKIKEGIAEILAAEGYVDSFKVQEAGVGRALTIRLRYGDDRGRVLKGIKRISSPGHRVYRAAAAITRVQGGLGVAILSTSQGLLTDREARRRNVGGEVVCEVW